MAKTILLTLLISLILVLIAVLAMAFRPLFIKGGRFRSLHIGDSKEMRKRGISCATSQDREARKNIK